MFAQSGFADLPFTGKIPPVIYSLTGSAGAYSYTGIAASFTLSKKLIADAGTYSYTGIAATLLYTPGVSSVAYTLIGTAGSYLYTGKTATLLYTAGSLPIAYSLLGSAGAYLYTGGNATFEYVLRGWHPVNTTQTTNWVLILKDTIWTNFFGDAVGWTNTNGNLVYWGTDVQVPNWTIIDTSQQSSGVGWQQINNSQ